MQTGTVSLGTISLMDWRPKDNFSCSFGVMKYGLQQQSDPYIPGCGNGVLSSNGQQIVNDPNDAYEPIAEDLSAGLDDLPDAPLRPGERGRRDFVEHG